MSNIAEGEWDLQNAIFAIITIFIIVILFFGTFGLMVWIVGSVIP